MINFGRRNDNSSVNSPAKSVRTIKTRLNVSNEDEVKKYDPPYFKDHDFRKELENRTRKLGYKDDGEELSKTRKDPLGNVGRMVTELQRKNQ